jgi:hypothetical protein
MTERQVLGTFYPGEAARADRTHGAAVADARPYLVK